MDEMFDFIDSDAEHIEKFVSGFESIIAQYTDNGLVGFAGNESYAVGVLKASSAHFNIHKGFENFITDGAKKIYDMIVSFFKSIYEFLFGKEKKIEGTQKNFDKVKDKLSDKEALDFDNKDLDSVAGRKVVKLRKLCAKLVDDFSDPKPYIDQMDDVIAAYKACGGNFPGQSKFNDMKTFLDRVSKSLENNIRHAREDSMFHSADVTAIVNAGRDYVRHYNYIFDSMNKLVNSAEFKKLCENADSSKQKLVNTFTSKLNKLTQVSTKKLALIWDVSNKMVDVTN